MNIYSLVVNTYFDLSDLYCLGMATDLSQSLDLSIYRYKNYILLISIADRVDLVLYYLFTTADRFTYDIGSKINDMSSALSRSAIVYRFNRGFFVLISCWLQDQINWHANIPEGEFWTCTGVKQSFGPALELSRSPRSRVLRQHAFGTPGGTTNFISTCLKKKSMPRSWSRWRI